MFDYGPTASQQIRAPFGNVTTKAIVSCNVHWAIHELSVSKLKNFLAFTVGVAKTEKAKSRLVLSFCQH